MGHISVIGRVMVLTQFPAAGIINASVVALSAGGAETIAPRCYQYFQKMRDKQNHKGTLKNSFQITMVVHACNPTGRQETCCEPEDSLSYVVTTSLAREAYKDSVSKIKNKNKKTSEISSPTIQNILCICLGWSLALHLFLKSNELGR